MYDQRWRRYAVTLLLIFSPIYAHCESLYVFLSPIQEASIRARVEVPVTAVNKHLGEHFRAGEVLISFDDTIYQARLQRAIAHRNKTRADRLAQNLLFREKATSFAKLEEAKAEYLKAGADVTEALELINACQVIAPYDGHVEDVFIELHETPAEAQTVVKILNDSRLIGRVLVPSTYLGQLKLDQVVSLDLTDLQESISGTIYRIGAAIDPASSTVKVEIIVDNADDALRAGMSGHVVFEQGVTDDSTR